MRNTNMTPLMHPIHPRRIPRPRILDFRVSRRRVRDRQDWFVEVLSEGYLFPCEAKVGVCGFVQCFFYCPSVTLISVPLLNIAKQGDLPRPQEPRLLFHFTPLAMSTIPQRKSPKFPHLRIT
jgi:hypothetical protein